MSGAIVNCIEGNWCRLPQGALFRAVKEFDSNELKELFSQPNYKGEANCRDGDYASLLHILAFSGPSFTDARDIIQVILDAGGDIDIENQFGETSMYIATRYGQKGMMLALKDAKKKNKAKTSNAKGEESDNDMTPESFRQQGNRYYMNEDYDNAIDYYSMSIGLGKKLGTTEDHRTHGNLSAAYLKLANYNYFIKGSEYRKTFKKAFCSARQAVAMEPTYMKHYYRLAKGYIGYRQMTLAKEACADGIKQSTSTNQDDNEKSNECNILIKLYNRLDELGVPDDVLDSTDPIYRQAVNKLSTMWMGDCRCPYCSLVVIELDEDGNMPDKCPFCVCDPRLDVNQDIVDNLIRF